MFIWSNESIQWYMRAAEHSDFFSIAANEIQTYINKEDTVSEIGCGLGYLGLAMAPFVKKFTAIDIDKRVIDVLNYNMKLSNILNIEAVHMDWELVSASTWDNVVVCNFGNFPEDLSMLMTLCRKQLILIRRIWEKDSDIYANMFALNDFLGSNSYCYKYIQQSIEFGQPFHSKDEAESFFIHYGEMPEMDKEVFLNLRLIPNKDKKYPFYYPCRSTTMFYIIQKQ